MVIENKPHTIQDFEAFLTLPENQERLFELVDGEIVEKMPTEKHGALQAEIARPLGNFVKPRKLGRVTVEARYRPENDAENDRLPDVSFTSKERMLPLVEHGAVLQIPDLVVEIQSPNDSLRKMRAKADYYLAHGARMVLLVLTQKRLIEVYTHDDALILDETDTLAGGDVLPGFTLSVKDVFDVE